MSSSYNTLNHSRDALQLSMAALHMMAFGEIDLHGNFHNNQRASYHCLPFSQALTAVSWLTTLSMKDLRSISCSRWRASHHWLPFSQVLTTALQLTASGAKDLRSNSCSDRRAAHH